MLIDEGDISNYIGVNIKKHSYGTFELLQSHLAEKIIKCVRFTVSVSLNSINKPNVKQLLHKDDSSQEIKCVWNYISAVGMLSYLKGYI